MKLTPKWQKFLAQELASNSFVSLSNFLHEAYKQHTIYPRYEDIFRTFTLIAPEDVKVVIIGQDPYHGENQANGLAFSVHKGIKTPPSLKNIYKELIDDIGCVEPKDGDLTSWAKQGVFLINSVLTVEQAKPNSHKAKGWELFTDSVIKKLSSEMEHLVFILWGAPSQKKAALIDEKRHLILKAPHPSPLSAYRGFFGSKPFSQTNNYLKNSGISEIQWCKNGYIKRSLLE